MTFLNSGIPATARTVDRGSIVNRLSQTREDNADQYPIQRATIAIIVDPIGFVGYSSAQLADSGRIIVPSSRQPFLESARALLSEGFPPSAWIELWYRAADSWALRALLQVAAGLDVAETPYGPKFVRYRPPGNGAWTALERPPARLQRQEVPK